MNLPGIAELGTDLLVTTSRRRRWALARPFVGIACFAAAVWAGWWWLTPLIVFGVFVAVVTVTHDVVHGTLGLDARRTDRWLFVLGVLLLESGHAYRITHHQHHRVFPGDDDPEGYPARLSMPAAMCYGPVFLIRLWIWAFRRASRAERRWLAAEAGAPAVVLGAGALCWSSAPGVLSYAVLVVAGSWVYPFLTVYLPHHDFGDDPLTQTRTLRGRIVPAVFLELTYHLEHHLYPRVPSHHLAALARRLDPVLAEAGVRPVRVP